MSFGDPCKSTMVGEREKKFALACMVGSDSLELPSAVTFDLSLMVHAVIMLAIAGLKC